MEEMSQMMNLIMTHAHGGIEGGALRVTMLELHPGFTDGEFYSALLSLQNDRHLIAADVDGSWVYTFVTPEDYIETEYSPAFAEAIIEADCGEWTEIDIDSFIAELEEKIKKANKRRGGQT